MLIVFRRSQTQLEAQHLCVLHAPCTKHHAIELVAVLCHADKVHNVESEQHMNVDVSPHVEGAKAQEDGGSQSLCRRRRLGWRLHVRMRGEIRSV